MQGAAPGGLVAGGFVGLPQLRLVRLVVASTRSQPVMLVYPQSRKAHLTASILVLASHQVRSQLAHSEALRSQVAEELKQSEAAR